MILQEVNNLTDGLLEYYKKIVELEGALISFNITNVSKKQNEIMVLRVMIDKRWKELEKAFVETTNKPFTAENFEDYCSGDTSLSIARANLHGYCTECRKILDVIFADNEHAKKVSENFFGKPLEEKANPKFGKWGKKAKNNES